MLLDKVRICGVICHFKNHRQRLFSNDKKIVTLTTRKNKNERHDSFRTDSPLNYSH